MALSADWLRGYTDTIILNQLREADSYGYAITKRVSELSGGALELKEATLYTAFRRMETAGYIISYWGNEGSGARRRYYSITVEGRDKLAEDLAAWQDTKRILDTLLNRTDHFSGMKDKDENQIPVIRVEESENE